MQDPRKRRRVAEKAAAGETEDAEMVESIENLEDTKGYTIREWVTMLVPRTEIANRFKNFLRTYVNQKGLYEYKERMRRMVENNQVFTTKKIGFYVINFAFFTVEFYCGFSNFGPQGGGVGVFFA